MRQRGKKHRRCYDLGCLLAGLLMLPAAVHAQQTPKQPSGQHRVPADGDAPPPQPLEPGVLFVGEWEWADAGQVFHLTLTRDPAFIYPGYPNDPPSTVVIGQFVYKRNGVIVDQSLTTGRRPYAALGSPADNSTMEMSFYESGTKGFGYLTLTLRPHDPTKLQWELRSRETYYNNPADRPAVPFLMPRTMTLTRK